MERPESFTYENSPINRARPNLNENWRRKRIKNIYTYIVRYESPYSHRANEQKKNHSRNIPVCPLSKGTGDALVTEIKTHYK